MRIEFLLHGAENFRGCAIGLLRCFHKTGEAADVDEGGKIMGMMFEEIGNAERMPNADDVTGFPRARE